MVVSLTTTPTMCAYLLKAESGEKHGRIYQVSEKFFAGMLDLYRRTLEWVLDNSGLMLMVLLLTVALNVVVFFKIPKGFFPQQDTGVIIGGLQGPQDASFPVMDDSIKQFRGDQERSAVANVVAFTGGGGGTNGGFIYMALKPLNERKISAAHIISRLRPKMLNRLPVASVFLQACPGPAHRRPGRAMRFTSTPSSATTFVTFRNGGPSC